jgi:hydrogenase maturation protease
VGQAVLEALRQRALGPQIELIDGGTAGLESAILLEGRSRVIIIDAADFGAAPGTFRRMELTAQNMEARPVHSDSLHAAGLMEALALATALGTMPAQVTLFGVQPRSLDYETELSQQVCAAIPDLVQSIVVALYER